MVAHVVLFYAIHLDSALILFEWIEYPQEFSSR